MKLVKGSVKRTIAFATGMTLCICAVVMTAACAYRVSKTGDLGAGGMGSFSITMLALGGHSVANYHKRPVKDESTPDL